MNCESSLPFTISYTLSSVTQKLMTRGNKTEFLIKIQSYYFPACGTETKQHLSVCHLPLTFEQKFSDSPCLCFHQRWAVSQIAGCMLQTWWSICEPTEVSVFAVIWILKQFKYRLTLCCVNALRVTQASWEDINISRAEVVMALHKAKQSSPFWSHRA